MKKALVVTDMSLIKFGVTKLVTDILDKENINFDVFTDIKPNPTVKNCIDGINTFDKCKPDAICRKC